MIWLGLLYAVGSVVALTGVWLFHSRWVAALDREHGMERRDLRLSRIGAVLAWIGVAIMLTVVMAAIFSGAAYAREGRPEMREDACSVTASMVLIARSLAVAGVTIEQTRRALGDIYAEYLFVGTQPEAFINFAYWRKEPPVPLARSFFKECLANGRSLDHILGIGV